MRGKFIVIEGGVGSGKSTLFNKLKKKFKNWQFYREPGSTPFGEKIRDAVQGIYKFPVDKYASLFAYNSARANLVRGKIIPNLEKGKTVILDRYWFSTYAYQGAEGVNKKDILTVCKIASANLIPDLIIHLDINPDIGIKRKAGKKDSDRYDLKKLNFHKKVRNNYFELSKMFGKIWKFIDAEKSKSEVYNDVLNILKKEKIWTKS